MIQDTVSKLKELQIRANQVVAEYASSKKSLSDLYDIRSSKIEEQERLQKDEDILQKTMSLFKNLSEQENEKSKNLFIALVNFGLHSIFGEDVSFDLEMKQYATGTFYSPILIKNGEQEDIMSSGGGILDIVSFLCRIVVLVSFYTKESRVLRLDEPFKNLSKEYREKAVILMGQLSEQFGIQFIMVTHIDEFANIPGARVFVTSQKDGRTKYTTQND